MARRYHSDVEGQTNRTLEVWAEAHPQDDPSRPPPPKDFDWARMVGIVGAVVLLIVGGSLWQSHRERRRREERAAEEAEAAAAAERAEKRLEREERRALLRETAEQRRKAAEEARKQRELLEKIRAEQAARLKKQRGEAEVARRVEEVPERQVIEGPPEEVVTVSATLVEMRQALEVLNRMDDPYSVYALGQHYYGQVKEPELVSCAKETMAAATYELQKARTRYPALVVSAPVSMDRIVTTHGGEVVGRIVGRSSTAVLIDVWESSDGDQSQKALKHEEIRHVGKAHIPPETVNQRRLAMLAQEVVTVGRAKKHPEVLSAWGKLCCEFPDEDPATVIAGVLGEEDRGKINDTVGGFLKEAVSWACCACPECLGRQTVCCPECEGGGTVSLESVCPRCNGKKEDCPSCPTPHPFEMVAPGPPRENQPPIRTGPPPGYRYRGIPGTVRCTACNGTGRRASRTIGPFRTSGVCQRCGGAGEKRCPKFCQDGFLVCPRCRDKGKVTVDSECSSCKGTKQVSCLSCGGTGRRRSLAERLRAPLLEDVNRVDEGAKRRP